MSGASHLSCVLCWTALSSTVLLICPLNKLTGVIQLQETPSSLLSLCVLFAVYLVLRCAIRLDGKVYSAQISSQSIPANINDVFLIGVHREFRGLRQNKQWVLEQKLAQAARHRKASSILPKC